VPANNATNHKPVNKELLSDADVKFAIVNALAFYAEFHDNALEDVDLKFWRRCFNADASDLKERHDLTVDRLSTEMANYHG
jgi:hypothetical protein